MTANKITNKRTMIPTLGPANRLAAQTTTTRLIAGHDRTYENESEKPFVHRWGEEKFRG